MRKGVDSPISIARQMSYGRRGRPRDVEPQGCSISVDSVTESIFSREKKIGK